MFFFCAKQSALVCELLRWPTAISPKTFHISVGFFIIVNHYMFFLKSSRCSLSGEGSVQILIHTCCCAFPARSPQIISQVTKKVCFATKKIIFTTFVRFFSNKTHCIVYHCLSLIHSTLLLCLIFFMFLSEPDTCICLPSLIMNHDFVETLMMLLKEAAQ